MGDINNVVERYVAIWNETDAALRRDLIAMTLSEDVSYLDPMMQGDGHDGFDAMIAAAQQQLAGHELRLDGEVDSFQDRVRFDWKVVNVATGDVFIRGIDFGVVAEDGRLHDLTGFLTQVPVMAEAH